MMLDTDSSATGGEVNVSPYMAFAVHVRAGRDEASAERPA